MVGYEQEELKKECFEDKTGLKNENVQQQKIGFAVLILITLARNKQQQNILRSESSRFSDNFYWGIKEGSFDEKKVSFSILNLEFRLRFRFL